MESSGTLDSQCLNPWMVRAAAMSELTKWENSEIPPGNVVRANCLYLLHIKLTYPLLGLCILTKWKTHLRDMGN